LRGLLRIVPQRVVPGLHDAAAHNLLRLPRGDIRRGGFSLQDLRNDSEVTVSSKLARRLHLLTDGRSVQWPSRRRNSSAA